MGTVVERYEHRGDKVVATLTDGREFEGDVLIGADGIRSKLRAQMRGADPEKPPLAYAGYAVYTAVCKYSQPHREPESHGPEQGRLPSVPRSEAILRLSDVGNGEQQYYAFLEVPPGGDDEVRQVRKVGKLSRDAHGPLQRLGAGGHGASRVHATGRTSSAAT